MADRGHWYGGTAKCPIRAYARLDDLELEMANWGISKISEAAIIHKSHPTVINLPLAVILGKAPEDFAKTLIWVVRRL